MDPQTRTYAVSLLSSSLGRLAARASEQIAYLTDMGREIGGAPVDELALEFEDAFVMLPQLEEDRVVGADTAQALREVDCLLENLDYSLSGLRDPLWCHVRQAAAAALRALETDLAGPGVCPSQ